MSVAARKSGNAVFVEYGSHKSFDATIAALKYTLAQNDMMVLGTFGFRIFHSLMGVLLTGRIMQGPAGYAVDHPGLRRSLLERWNGASFDIIYALVFGPRPWWVAWIYFGILLGPQFAIAVYLATQPMVLS